MATEIEFIDGCLRYQLDTIDWKCMSYNDTEDLYNHMRVYYNNKKRPKQVPFSEAIDMLKNQLGES